MKKSIVIQCRRCQRFHHTTAACAYRYRCVQCCSIHEPGSCPRATNKKLPLQCCNCTEAGLSPRNHTANNLSECSYFKQRHNQLHARISARSNLTAATSVKRHTPVSAPPTRTDTTTTAFSNGSGNLANLNNRKRIKSGKRSANISDLSARGDIHATSLPLAPTNTPRAISIVSDEKLNNLATAIVSLLRDFITA